MQIIINAIKKIRSYFVKKLIYKKMEKQLMINSTLSDAEIKTLKTWYECFYEH